VDDTDRIVTDIDPHSKEYLDDRHARWAELRRGPASFSPRDGGFRVIPDDRVDRGATTFYEVNPELTGVITMPATFTPGHATGPAEPPF
jgi:hypothetical protein